MPLVAMEVTCTQLAQTGLCGAHLDDLWTNVSASWPPRPTPQLRNWVTGTLGSRFGSHKGENATSYAERCVNVRNNETGQSAAVCYNVTQLPASMAGNTVWQRCRHACSSWWTCPAEASPESSEQKPVHVVYSATATMLPAVGASIASAVNSTRAGAGALPRFYIVAASDTVNAAMGLRDCLLSSLSHARARVRARATLRISVIDFEEVARRRRLRLLLPDLKWPSPPPPPPAAPPPVGDLGKRCPHRHRGCAERGTHPARCSLRRWKAIMRFYAQEHNIA